MGLFYSNLTVRTPDRGALLAALRRRGSSAFVGPDEGGLAVVFERLMDDQDFRAVERLGKGVTKALSCPALAAVLHDDDVLYLWLFGGGRVLDRYDSAPAYFDPHSGHKPPDGGDAGLICGAFGRDDRRGRVEQLLRADLLEVELPGVPGEQERHAALAAELGLPGYVAGLGYAAIAGGYVAAEFRGVPFEAV